MTSLSKKITYAWLKPSIPNTPYGNTKHKTKQQKLLDIDGDMGYLANAIYKC